MNDVLVVEDSNVIRIFTVIIAMIGCLSIGPEC